jgi:hypothetical protein
MIMGLPLLGSPLMYSPAHIPLGRGGALDSSRTSGDVVENEVDLSNENRSRHHKICEVSSNSASEST